MMQQCNAIVITWEIRTSVVPFSLPADVSVTTSDAPDSNCVKMASSEEKTPRSSAVASPCSPSFLRPFPPRCIRRCRRCCCCCCCCGLCDEHQFTATQCCQWSRHAAPHQCCTNLTKITFRPFRIFILRRRHNNIGIVNYVFGTTCKLWVTDVSVVLLMISVDTRQCSRHSAVTQSCRRRAVQVNICRNSFAVRSDRSWSSSEPESIWQCVNARFIAVESRSQGQTAVQEIFGRLQGCSAARTRRNAVNGVARHGLGAPKKVA